MRADCAFGAVWSDQRLSAVVEGAEAPRDGGPRVIDVATDGLLRCGEQVLVGLGSAGRVRCGCPGWGECGGGEPAGAGGGVVLGEVDGQAGE